ncbi:GTP pyrophosphokinase family protein [Psychrobacillus sp.]|uniref:GTP pyrophosphokinase n=1 Tax=Psychrobacillus sp. TaxID=1871623 RepID=UPI0028BDDA19|nr:GTP pyrophosphokinase family protein [Psychrobacillus sp.]
MTTDQMEQVKRIRTEMKRFMLMYKFALSELETKIEILQEEFQIIHDYSPIEHTKSRIKSPESILKKIQRKDMNISLTNIRENVKDIAGMRITCSFISDIYQILDMLQNQSDITVVEIKDYIKDPKENGYQSLHLLIKIPVFMSDRTELVPVEVQIRTIAMDFWASLEHKIFYKYDQFVPEHLLEELKEAADSAAALDQKMERLHNEVKAIKDENKLELENESMQLMIKGQQFTIPPAFLKLLEEGEILK